VYSPSPLRGPGASRLALAAPLGLLAIGALVLAFLIGQRHPQEPPASPDSKVVVTPSPNVIVSLRELARLETVDYHVERVIELADEQVRLWGLVHAKDAMLLVAAGDVVAGVDLSKMADGDVEVDWPHRRVHVKMPAPEVFTVAIDNARTHVVSRSTDALATRHEELEGRARQEAETSMRAGALEAGIEGRARTGAEKALRELLHGLGFEQIAID
jgi:hypothetical protein